MRWRLERDWTGEAERKRRRRRIEQEDMRDANDD